MPGIGPLTGALEAFVEFFHIDRDLVAAAAERTATSIPRPISVESARVVISSLSEDEKTGLLMQIVQGDLNVTSKLRADISRRVESARGCQQPCHEPR